MRSFWKTFPMMCYFATLISVKFEWIDEGETRRVRSHANAWMFLNDFNDAVIQWTYGTVKNWGFLKGSRMLLCNANVPAQPVGNLSRNSIKKKKRSTQPISNNLNDLLSWVLYFIWTLYVSDCTEVSFGKCHQIALKWGPKYELIQIQLLFHMIDQAEARAPLQIQEQITPAGTAACL